MHVQSELARSYHGRAYSIVCSYTMELTERYSPKIWPQTVKSSTFFKREERLGAFEILVVTGYGEPSESVSCVRSPEGVRTAVTASK